MLAVQRLLEKMCELRKGFQGMKKKNMWMYGKLYVKKKNSAAPVFCSAAVEKWYSMYALV